MLSAQKTRRRLPWQIFVVGALVALMRSVAWSATGMGNRIPKQGTSASAPAPLADPKFGDGAWYTEMAFSPDGTLLAAATSERIVIWRVRDRSIVANVHPYTSTPGHIAWSPDGRYLAAAATGGFGKPKQHMMVWRTDKWRPVSVFQSVGQVESMQFVPNAAELVISTGDVQVVRWNFATKRIACVYRSSALGRGVARVSGDGRLVYFQNAEGRRIVWQTATGRRMNQPFDSSLFEEHKTWYPESWSVMATSEEGGFSAGWGDGTPAPVLVRTHTPKRNRKRVKRLPWFHPLTSVAASPSVSVTKWPVMPSTKEEPQHFAQRQGVPPDEGTTEWEWHGTHEVQKWALVRQDTASQATVADIVVITKGPGSITARHYRFPTAANTFEFSPDGRYLTAIATYPDGDLPAAAAVRLLDLETSRLSPLVTAASYDPRTMWSPNSRYIALYDGGYRLTKYSTARTLLCWDLNRSSIRPVLTSWGLDAQWLSNGILEMDPDPGSISQYNPVTGRILLTK